ncbi:MAG: glucose-6-phosphate isomerase [Planctomycetota bacterium]|nr:glucose-6-phosphate isomerase [Planctomycetota bacterium]
MQPLSVDLSGALERTLGPGRGLPASALEAEVARLADLPSWMEAERAAGRADWFDLPLDEGPAEEIRAWRAAALAVDDVVIVGIGGSALTARIVDAVRPSAGLGPRLHVIDTVDPRAVEALTRSLDAGRTHVIGVSKSGGTLETTAVFLVLEAWLVERLGSGAAAHLAVIAGPGENPLRRHAEVHGYPAFLVPEGVGGRYSALTPVGLAPAAAVGLDPRVWLRGAEAVRGRCLDADPQVNPALALAAVHGAAERAGRGVAVLWPYGVALQPLAPWWVQLVGESLGKPGPDGPVGVAPLGATGPADQHSLLQLLVEGPDDKLVVFVRAGGEPRGPTVPIEGDAMCYAAGRSLGAILEAEQRATAEALAAAGRPSITIDLVAADATGVAAFLFAYQAAVVYWGRLLGVDPFGQPGVQGGKDATRRLLTE